MDVILVDDIVDTAGTITKAADLIMAGGANSVRAIASHCIMSGPADQRVDDSALVEMVFTDSITTIFKLEAYILQTSSPFIKIYKKFT